ncbi:MAG: hypothetical protein ACYS0H_20855, partial [Planctomycetota bacterium]
HGFIRQRPQRQGRRPGTLLSDDGRLFQPGPEQPRGGPNPGQRGRKKGRWMVDLSFLLLWAENLYHFGFAQGVLCHFSVDTGPGGLYNEFIIVGVLFLP